MRWVVGALLLIPVAVAPGAAQQQSGFPHERHANLFPLCEACHSGVLTGNQADVYPAPASCNGCHDGNRAPVISWARPGPRESNLVFTHTEHANAISTAGRTPIDCDACHGTTPGVRMAVAGPDPQLCAGCHDGPGTQHLDLSRNCTQCHAPLAQTPVLSMERIEGFPAPAGHAAPDFAQNHGQVANNAGASCATCHARETCTRCHFNQEQVPAIMALEPDSRVASLVEGLPPEYHVPESHRDGTWSWSHAAAARVSAATCANCHTRSSCASCHQNQTPAALPTLPAGDPRGVQLSPMATRVHPPSFVREHGSDAVSGTCESCHATSYCESCHQGPTSPVFHAPNFLARHAPEAYSADMECASCHNPELFCRACHTGVGLSSQGRLTVAFHTSNPFWLFGHGAAARQGLEACASCHAQSTCTQCHSAVGAWRINPHGPGFDPDQAGSTNRITCTLCH